MNEEQVKELAETTARSKSNTHRLDKLEENTKLMHEMNKNIAVIAEQTKDTKEDVKSLRTDVEEIKAKPNKLVDSVKQNAIGVVVGALVGAILAFVF